MELVLWRHGQTDANLHQRIQGRSNIPLNATGVAQAQAVAPALAALEPHRIVCSPLKRALQTAEVLGERCGLAVTVEEGLVERSFGAWEGKDRQEIAAGWPEEYRRWREGGEPRGLGVETRDQVATRVRAALERICATAEEDERVVVVSHGSALSIAASSLLGQRVSAWFGLRGLDNCRYGVLRSARREPGWVLTGWNLG
ncbi:histidine phosphatase family protein [Actinomyces slackii]|uniref:Phosphoglyceromutase n=3 Tax=Actinomyces slackii TaxID=52774 RepID=A0A3S4STW8_9ACTO|nr:histidine phosphatase family protein [Actinomyces slackii]VEG74950.1 Phosphoglyceromutase [Actinomyces slackii]